MLAMTHDSHSGKWDARRAAHSAYVARERAKKQRTAKTWAAHLRVQTTLALAGDVLDRYLAEHRTPDSVSVIETWVRPAFGTLRVEEVGPREIEAWILAMRHDAEIRGSVLPANTERTRYGTLRTAFAWAHKQGLIAVNNARLPLGILQPRRHRVGFDPSAELPSVAEFVAILTGPFPLDRRLDYALAGCAGLRGGERYDLRVEDVDLDRRPLPSIAVDSSWNRKLAKSTPTKSRVARVVPAHARSLVPLLRAWIGQGWERAHGRAPVPGDLLLPRVDRHGRLCPRNDRQALKRWHKDLRVLGLAPRRLHALRHFFVTTLVHAGADWRAVERITHPAPRWRTAEGYVHTSFEWLCDTVSKLPVEIDDPKL